ncbi:phosphoadenosine phosphosulfate reductase domain-containing protein [Robertkochia aurantiaca]|uniref:phosphoadenosine phosphosulfate reductase domain-containing protein n=1 Tax=Robertkochia aurantiaca TaxID=2873700 RepID=UPI001CCD3389|nr:phosphoadenosine phosphosulfate reductase family protein [Robertkochia sp. 3YJGBD-33]
MNTESINTELKDRSPEEIIIWALEKAERPVITTNFRPYEAVILHAVTRLMPEIPVIWCDTGYNTAHTYRYAENLIEELGLNIHLYVPKQTVAHREVIMGIPDIDDPLHEKFTYQVKLEPFKRAMRDLNPDLWFTNLRKGQTALRDSLDIVSTDRDERIKVSPFYHYSDKELDRYMDGFRLENENRYFDPTKVHGNRECGLHLS